MSPANAISAWSGTNRVRWHSTIASRVIASSVSGVAETRLAGWAPKTTFEKRSCARNWGWVRCCVRPARVRVFRRSHSSAGNDGLSRTSAASSNSRGKFSVSALPDIVAVGPEAPLKTLTLADIVSSACEICCDDFVVVPSRIICAVIPLRPTCAAGS